MTELEYLRKLHAEATAGLWANCGGQGIGAERCYMPDGVLSEARAALAPFMKERVNA